MLLNVAGGESGLCDAKKSDGQALLGVTGMLVAGALIGNGSYHYLCDESVSGGSGVLTITNRNPAASGLATTYQVGCIGVITNVTTPAYDVWLMQEADFVGINLLYARLTDGKVHLMDTQVSVTVVANNGSGKARFTATTAFVTALTNGDTVFHKGFADATYNGLFVVSNKNAGAGTYDCAAITFNATGTGLTWKEIDPAHAFTPVTGANIGLIIEIDSGTPFQVRVRYWNGTGDPTVASSWTTPGTGSQSGNAAARYLGGSSTFAFSFAEVPGSGVNHNWTLAVDNCWLQDTNGSVNNTLQPYYQWDSVLEGMPNLDSGAHNDYLNHSGTACSVGGSNCHTEVDPALPPSTSTGYISPVVPAINQYQTFPTDTRHIGPNDIIGAVDVLPFEYYTGSIGFSWRPMIRDGGTDRLSDSFDQPQSTAVFYYWGTNSGTTTAGRALFDTNSSGAAWTPARAQAAEIGHAIGQTSGVQVLRVRALYKLIAYKAGPLAHSLFMRQAVKRASTY